VGTFALVLFGCGAIMGDAGGGGLGHVGISLAVGLVVAAMVFAFADVSGAHINPAVTLAARRRCPGVPCRGSGKPRSWGHSPPRTSSAYLLETWRASGRLPLRLRLGRSPGRS
jgi:hypothetical protein